MYDVTQDSRAEAIVDEILKRRPDLTKGEVWSMIHRKMEGIGDGYLTEVGAGYLVASELGVDLEVLPSPSLRLAELRSGLKRVDVRAFFLCKGRERSFVGRTGGGKYSEYFIFDAGLITRVIAWGEPDYKNVLDALKLGDFIKLLSVSVRSGITGDPEVHMGSKSSIDVLSGKPPGGLIETVTLEVDEIDEGSKGRVIVVKGKLASEIGERTYTQDGEMRTMSYFVLSKGDARIRVVIWGRSRASLADIGSGSVIRLVCTRARLNRYGRLELHGDVNTTMEVIEHVKPSLNEGEYLLVSIGEQSSGQGEPLVDAVLASSENTIFVRARGDAATKLLSLPPGSLVRIRTAMLGSMHSVSKEEDIEELGYKPELLNQYKVITKDLGVYGNEVGIYEGFVLSKPSEKEVLRRSGERVRKANVVVGDYTGEVNLVAWRRQADRILGLSVGDKIMVYGAAIKRREGFPPELEVKGYTTIVKKR